jgi:hypothetical protein
MTPRLARHTTGTANQTRQHMIGQPEPQRHRLRYGTVFSFVQQRPERSSHVLPSVWRLIAQGCCPARVCLHGGFEFIVRSLDGQTLCLQQP